jgi:hypothetical protein
LGATVDRQGVVANCLGAAVNCQGVVTSRQGVIADCQGVIADCQGVIDLAALRPKSLSLQDVLFVEVIDLDIWIFMPNPRWASTVIVYDNDLV